MRKILVLWHEHLRPARPHHLIDALVEAWRSRGLEVSYVYGTRDRPEADLLIPHVDLTRTPPEYVEYVRSYPAVVNRDLFDISKRAISANLLAGDEDYRGPVIVKTDCNTGGGHEYRLSLRRHPVLGRLRRRLAPIAERALGRHLAWRVRLRGYPVYDSLDDVPPGAFTNPVLVVERFLPEREGDRYFVRHYLCLGDRTRSVRVAGTTPFLKRGSAVLVDEGIEVPEEVLSLRRRLGLDYGKIDYVMHEGQAVILDVNRTTAQPSSPEVTARAVADLADGIWSLLPER